MKRYIIVAPKYSKSNGVRVLYMLADHLKKRGFEVYIYAPKSDEDEQHEYISKITEEMKKNDIVVYPEIVNGNPLQFQNVVRWILYFPGVLNGSKKYADYEVKFTWDEKYYKDCNILCMPSIDESLFYYDGTKKDIDCYFYHKGGKWRKIKEFESMTEITMNYPKTRKELANLLRRTKTLYSYDRDTLLMEEALKCNCVVKIVEEDGFSDYVSKHQENCKNFENQLDNFIRITQNMNYTGKIQKPVLRIIFANKIKYLYYKLTKKNKEKEEKYKYKVW